MKRYSIPLLAALGGLALATGHTAFAQPQDYIINTFDNAESIASWTKWWGGAVQTYEFDPSMDANNNANSGSLKATIEFDAGNGDNQFALQGGFPENAVLNGTTYTNLVFNLRWAGTSPQRPSGDFGYLEPGFRAADWSQIWLTGFNVTPGDEWIQVTLPINPTASKLDQINGVVLKMWSGASGHTGTATFWVDNVKLIPSSTEVPRPTLGLSQPDPGLHLTASASGIYQRQNIRTTTSEYSWVGLGAPVTYSVTIKDYPDVAGFQTHIFLVPGDGLPTWESSPDWNRSEVIFLDISGNAEGGGYASFRYKVNEPNGNSMIYGAGTLGGVGSTNIVGTWTLKFTTDTTAEVTSPDGSTATFELPAEHAALFAGPLHAFFGVQPNGADRLGKTAIFSNVKISGVPTPIDENFEGVAPDGGGALDLDPAIWTRVADSAAGIVLVPSTAKLEINWTAPAAGFVLQSSPDLTTWTDVQSTVSQVGDKLKSVLTSLPDASKGFFRLVKP